MLFPGRCNLSLQLVINEHKEAFSMRSPGSENKTMSVLILLSYTSTPARGLGFAEALS